MTGPHQCDTGNFDLTLCPEPCGAMHSYCDTCGARQDPCAHDAKSARQVLVKTLALSLWDAGLVRPEHVGIQVVEHLLDELLDPPTTPVPLLLRTDGKPFPADVQDAFRLALAGLHRGPRTRG